ncbi:F-box/WD-40 repeat-containing protein at3g52030 [Phtheirospermum japonicum]|uniref:F-box/WD-40 repeat-containing protein at3g52030 n=1 Tax=Phtheirospermum japonicum TaxID=374723 RepID=A0A830BHQ2_9LAMI|nr:F-box/WD-40 repeat-containing protein at3g52030 [Phtheirospermum japonicum]
MDPATSAGLRPPQAKKRRRATLTTVDALGNDVLCMIFAFLDLVHLIRCSAVCKSWSTVINKLKLLQIRHRKQLQANSGSGFDAPSFSERLINIQMEQLAMDRQKLSLQEGDIDIFQWKAHPVMRLWSAESCKALDNYFLPDKAPLIDFDFDESKVVGLVGTRICIWRRVGTRDLFSSRESLFTRGLCMRYLDPHAVVGCEDGKVRVFDMYSRKISQIIKLHPGAVSCLSFTDEQLIVSGSSHGGISISDLSSDQRVATLDTTISAGIKTLCLIPGSYKLFAGSSTGYASCWELRTLRRLWETRVSPNVLYSMHHLRNDKSTLVIGGIDGVLRTVDQDSGEVLSRCIAAENTNVSNRSLVKNGVIEKKKAIRLSEDERIDLMPNRPPITCLAVGMQKVVTTHGDNVLNNAESLNKIERLGRLYIDGLSRI